jgi:hypothetical protein
MRDIKVLTQWLLVLGLFMVGMGAIGFLANAPEPEKQTMTWWDFIQATEPSIEHINRSNSRAASIAIMLLGSVSAAIGYVLWRGASSTPGETTESRPGSVEEFIGNAKIAGLDAIKALLNFPSLFEAKSHPQTIARPAGVSLVAMYAALSGALSLLLGALIVVSNLHILTALYAITRMALGIASLLAAHGLWSLTPLGYHLSIILCLLVVPIDLLAIILSQTTAGSLFLTILSDVISIAILRYLSSPLTRSHLILRQAGAVDPAAKVGA